MAILPNGLNLSQAFIGNSEVQSAWLGDTKIWEKHSGRLPAGYTELSYIQGDGNAYIDAGFVADGNTRFEIDFETGRTPQQGNTDMSLFGARYEWNERQYQLADYVLSPWVGYFGYSAYTRNWFNCSMIAGRMQISFIGNTLTTSTGISVNIPTLSFTTPYNMVVFAMMMGGGAGEKSTFKIYSLKFYNLTIPIRNFVPCINPQNEVGMYDLVSQSFFGNAGTGSFIAGTPV